MGEPDQVPVEVEADTQVAEIADEHDSSMAAELPPEYLETVDEGDSKEDVRGSIAADGIEEDLAPFIQKIRPSTLKILEESFHAKFVHRIPAKEAPEKDPQDVKNS